MPRGLFITFEGPDKAGKSTQALRLVSNLKERGYTLIHTREPGGTLFSEKIREILLDTRHKVNPLAELLLYEAARAQHTQDHIRPALALGKIVICERYTLATEAYQGYGRGIALPLIRKLNAIASSGLRPDITFLLDMPAYEFKKRHRPGPSDRIERESIDFRERVRRGYLAAAKRDSRIICLNGKQSLEELQKEILKQTLKKLKGKPRRA